MSFIETLEMYCHAGYPFVGVQTSEETRVYADIIEVAEKLKKNFLIWSATSGAKTILPSLREIPESSDPLAMSQIREKNTIYVLLDFPGIPWERDPILTRAFKELLLWCPKEGSTVVIITPRVTSHPTIENMMVIVDYDLPDEKALKRIISEMCQSAGVDVPEETYDIITALGGMSATEASNALALSLVKTNELDPKLILEEKALSVKKSGLLEIIQPDAAGLDGIGGLENLKKWIYSRSKGYSKEAKEYGLNTPKGILITGVPGTGKSLVAKAVGTILGFPILRFDIGAMFNSLVGESEKTINKALALADAIAPCVIFIDEADKGFAGSSGSGSGDSGVTKRVFSSLLSWMQERPKPVFVVATANDVTVLPIEFRRKGRWDDLFAVDIPTVEERAAIVDIHLKKRKRNKWTASDIRTVAEATEGFTGAEIESAINDAMYSAFGEGGREFTRDDVIMFARKTIPLSVSAKEQVEGLRKWAKGRAIPAGKTESEDPSSDNTRRITRREEQ